MNELETTSSHRQAAIGGLAAVGFITLILASMWLAFYSIRFVPAVVGRIGAAAVYLGSVFTPAEKPSLPVIPTASTTIAFGDASSTPVSGTYSKPKAIEIITLPGSASQRLTATIAGAQSTSTTLLPAGLPDLAIKINAIGYLATSSATSFVASSTVPAGFRPAVNFTIKNIGTKVSGPWDFTASIPTQTAYVFQSPEQQTLAPGDSIDYTLGFDQATTGQNQVISITANPSHTVTESSFTNNTASTSITVLGN